jgi:hypothetical protein
MQLKIVEDGTRWRIEGAGSERARIAYAEDDNGRLAVSLEGQERNERKNHALLTVSS